MVGVVVDDISTPVGLADLPTELIAEIALHGPLIALRKVVRFNLPEVAAMRISRQARVPRERAGENVQVGDRVLYRWPTSFARPPCYGTVVADLGFHCGRKLWRVCLLSGERLRVGSPRLRRLEPWADIVWQESVCRTSALAAASVAREAATRATSAAMAAMSSSSSAAEVSLAAAAASAACTAAAAATSAATAAESSGAAGAETVPPAAAAPAASSAEARLLSMARDMRQVVAGSGFLSPPLLTQPRSGSGSTGSRIQEAARAAADAAAEAAAATHAAGAIESVGALTVTSGTAAAAATAAANVAAAFADWRVVEDQRTVLLRTGLPPLTPGVEPSRPPIRSTPSFDTATSAATSAAADVIAEIGLAGRALNASWAGVGRTNGLRTSSVEHTPSSEAVEEAATMVRNCSAAMLNAHAVGSSSADEKCEERWESFSSDSEASEVYEEVAPQRQCSLQ